MTTLFRALCAIALVLVAAPATAQTGEPTGPSESQMSAMQQLQDMQQQIQDLNQELMSIQESTLEARPKLAERRDDLLENVDAKMLAAGFDGPAQRAELDSLIAEHGDSTTTDAARMDLEQEIQAGQGAYQQAQQAAFEDPEIQEATQELNTELIAAMKELDPRTDQLIEELQTTQQRFQMMMQQAMQQQTQQGQPQGPQQGPAPDPKGQR